MNFNKYEIPDYMQDALIRYIDNKIEPGAFLMAVLCNDLSEACGRADDINKHLLFNYIRFLYNEAPRFCWGSKEKVREWLNSSSDT